MDKAKMYKVIHERENGRKELIDFLDFMVTNAMIIHKQDKTTYDDFIHHFYKIPSYMQDFWSKQDHRILTDLVTIQMAIDRAEKKLKYNQEER